MTDRDHRLRAARLLDWRFLLPDPGLERVGLIGAVDAGLRAALEELGIDAAGEASDATIVGAPTADDAEQVVARALQGTRPGGWILLEGGDRSRLARGFRRAGAALARAGAEGSTRAWHLPTRAAALRILPLDDAQALRFGLSRHGSSAARRVRALTARAAAAAGAADLLAGQVTLLARAPGGPPVSGWPILDSIADRLVEHGLTRPSWVLLTPRFPASAHVVLVLLHDGEPSLFAKVARLPGDPGPAREAATLSALATAGAATGLAPRVIEHGQAGGHEFVLEEALGGEALDRRRARSDPARWVAQVATWVAHMPVRNESRSAASEVVNSALDRLSSALGSDANAAALVDRTRALLAPLGDAVLPAVFEHGDLGHPNLLVGRDGSIGAVDWERGRPDGLPLNDLTFFLGYLSLAIEGESPNPFDGFERLLADPGPGAANALRSEARRLAVDPTLIAPLIIACWARATASALDQIAPDGRLDSSRLRTSRYHAMWQRAVDAEDRIAALFA